VTRLVLRQSMRLAAFGIALGSVLAAGRFPAICGDLVGINMFDSLAYGGGVLLVLAASRPRHISSRAQRRIDPITTLALPTDRAKRYPTVVMPSSF